jgi:hypothetical protein
MKKSDFKIKNSSPNRGWYAFIYRTDDYLFEPGMVLDWNKALTTWGTDLANKKAHFSSREELEECLNKYLEEQNMSEKMINIKGKEVSESTIVEALKKHINFKTTVPIISFVDFDNKKDRVVINLTSAMLRRIRNEVNAKQIVINVRGGVGVISNNYDLDDLYSNQEPIFGEIENGE